MRRYYANLLGKWTDITDEGTIQGENPNFYLKEGTLFGGGSELDSIHVQYNDKDYHIHISQIQVVTEPDR